MIGFNMIMGTFSCSLEYSVVDQPPMVAPQKKMQLIEE